MPLRVWTPNFDMSSIPDSVFKSEDSRRKSAKRKTFAGGVMWGQHNPDTARCRCAACMTERNERRMTEVKRPRGRPRKNAPAVANFGDISPNSLQNK